MLKYLKILWIYCFMLILVLARIRSSEAQASYCNVNGVTHQVGQSWTTATGNDRLKKCTCARRAQWNCAYVREDALMVVANVDAIAKVKLSDAIGFKTSFITNLKGRTVSVDVDVESDTIYWTDVSYERRGIYKATFSTGHDIRRIITHEVYEPNGIAVDWLAKNIYWTDAQMRAIYVAQENGVHKTMVVGGLSEPRGIAVLPLHGLMFWTDQETGTIETATMDGENRKVIMAGLEWPNEIAVDAMRTKIYWIDGKKRTIESCNFDGTSWKKVLDFSITFDSPGYGLSLLGNRLYFSVWRQKAVYSVTVLGQDLKLVIDNLNENLAGVAIVNQAMQQAPISSSVGPCRRHRSPCSHICLPQSRGGYTCACPEKTGMVLSQDLHTCKVPEEFIIYTSVYDGSIMISSKEFGTKPHPSLLIHASQPSAIDYDPQDKMIYWSDVAKNGIYRMSIYGSGYNIFLDEGIGTVDGIALDWVNRYLYFTNYGWESHDKQFARIEMIRLDGKDRKVLVYQDLDKPRDLVIDQQRGFIYYSDWGAAAKVVRLDLDGKNPSLIPVAVENPNGLALHDAILYITDSHRKSGFVEVNDTAIYGRPPSLVKYDTALDKMQENMDLDLEIPFGLTTDKDYLYLTDWGKKTISEINVKTGKLQTIVSGIGKPTGIVRASLEPQKKYINDCMKGKKCSHICVPVDQDHSSCMCPDHSGTALSEDESNCVAPDQFVLVADVNKIIMVSESPDDPSAYFVVRTYDDYSNIVAFVFDPITRFVYWADNGRQRICRKMLASPLGIDGGTTKDIEILYKEIENVEGMALDPDNRLLYWTDGTLRTIELLDLSTMTHATVIENLYNPRAIALDPSVGVLYWSEWGRAAMLMSAKMNGGDARPLITSGLKWPNGLYYDAGEDKIYMADGSTLEIRSISASGSFQDTSRIDALDYFNLNGSVDHIFGLSKLGPYLLFTDWESGSLYKLGMMESSILLTNLTRPTQVYAHTSTMRSEVKSQCSTSVHDCSHICVPSAGSYKCLCPDHLVLADNLKNCVNEENLHLYTTTLLPPIIEEELTTAEWAEPEATEPAPEDEDRTIRIERLPDPTTTTPNATEELTTTMEITTTIATTTTTTEETTTLPPLPRFPLCQGLPSNETLKFTVPVPDDRSTINIAADLIQLRALNVSDKDLKVELVDPGFSTLYIGNHFVPFKATDGYGRTVYCNTTITVQDVTPPEISNCPNDKQIESYDNEETTLVIWEEPTYKDNSGKRPIVVASHQPGEFFDGIHTVEYTVTDDAGNRALCKFMIAVMHRSARCGGPWAPPNSYLTCHSDLETGDQVCEVSCNEGYSLSLKTPFIRCREDLQDVSFDWLPFLDENVCKEPSIGNPQQVVTLDYPCPCRPTSTYYEYTYQILSNRLREAINCQTRRYSLGLCMNTQTKLFLQCVNGTNVELMIKVDLGRIEEVETMPEARRIVKRAVTDILDEAVGGRITARGSDMKDYQASEDAKLSAVAIICKKGYKSVEDGCIECPRGTFWKDENCEFCPLHTFQEKSGSSICVECETDKGTRNIGSTHRSHCIPMVRKEEAGQPSVILIAASVVGGVVAIAVLGSIFAACIYRRRNAKKAEMAAAERRRQRRNRRIMNANKEVSSGMASSPDEISTVSRLESDGGEFSDGRMSRRSGSSGKRVTIKEEAIEHRIPSSKEPPSRTEPKRFEPDWRMALAIRNKGIGKKAKHKKNSSNQKKEDISDKNRPPDDELKSRVSEEETEKSATEGHNSETDHQRTDTDGFSDPESVNKNCRRLMSSTSDLGDETISMTSGASSRPTTPIKGVLKKPRRLESIDDSLTDSTIPSAADPRLSGSVRGRDSLQRGARIGSGKSVSLDHSGQPTLGMRRSISFDQTPGPRRLLDRNPRVIPNSPGMNAQRQPMIPPMMPGMRQRFVGGPRIMNNPPPGAVIYRHPNHPNIRMAFVPMSQAPRGMMPGRMPAPPPYGYDDHSDWDSASQTGSEIDMRKPPRHMMPPPGMMPGFPPRPPYARMRMAGAPMRPPMRFPPRYVATVPTRFPPHP